MTLRCFHILSRQSSKARLILLIYKHNVSQLWYDQLYLLAIEKYSLIQVHVKNIKCTGSYYKSPSQDATLSLCSYTIKETQKMRIKVFISFHIREKTSTEIFHEVLAMRLNIRSALMRLLVLTTVLMQNTDSNHILDGLLMQTAFRAALSQTEPIARAHRKYLWLNNLHTTDKFHKTSP